MTVIHKMFSGAGFCDGKADGNYRDPDNCYGYISCTNQITVPMDCPGNLKYNEPKDKCDYPENVDCDPGEVCTRHEKINLLWRKANVKLA